MSFLGGWENVLFELGSDMVKCGVKCFPACRLSVVFGGRAGTGSQFSLPFVHWTQRRASTMSPRDQAAWLECAYGDLTGSQRHLFPSGGSTGAATVYQGLEQSWKILYKSLQYATVETVDHKYVIWHMTNGVCVTWQVTSTRGNSTPWAVDLQPMRPGGEGG